MSPPRPLGGGKKDHGLLKTREAVQPGFLINWLVVGLARRTYFYCHFVWIWSWSWSLMAETLDVNGMPGVNKRMLTRYARWHAASGEKATVPCSMTGRHTGRHPTGQQTAGRQPSE